MKRGRVFRHMVEEVVVEIVYLFYDGVFGSTTKGKNRWVRESERHLERRQTEADLERKTLPSLYSRLCPFNIGRS